MKNIIIIVVTALILVPFVIIAQEGLGKYERIVNLENRVSKLEKEVAQLKKDL